MARNLSSKCKQCRRAGQKLFLKAERCATAKCSMVKRNFPPGAHGIKGYGRLTDYGNQLREKQKAKKIYRILEQQFRNYILKANQAKANSEKVLIELLEMRFDNVIYRAGFAKSRDLARQLINHSHFRINDKRVDIPSCQVKIGQIISIREKSRKLKFFSNLSEQLKKVEPLSWLSVDAAKMEIKITDRPKLEETKGEFDPKLIIEFYSR